MDKRIALAFAPSTIRKRPVSRPVPRHNVLDRVLASGNTIEEAVFHALTEIVERDAWSIAKYNRNYGEPVAIEVTPENRFLIDIVRKFEEAGLEIIARDITSDVGIPVVAAFSKDLRHGDTLPSEGFGAQAEYLAVAATSARFSSRVDAVIVD